MSSIARGLFFLFFFSAYFIRFGSTAHSHTLPEGLCTRIHTLDFNKHNFETPDTARERRARRRSRRFFDGEGRRQRRRGCAGRGRVARSRVHVYRRLRRLAIYNCPGLSFQRARATGSACHSNCFHLPYNIIAVAVAAAALFPDVSFSFFFFFPTPLRRARPSAGRSVDRRHRAPRQSAAGMRV